MINFDTVEVFYDPLDWMKIVAVKVYYGLYLPDYQVRTRQSKEPKKVASDDDITVEYNQMVHDYAEADLWTFSDERVDGMNVLTVKEAASKALETIREGNGPYFMEIMTYRYRGHSMGDPERYRQSDEVKKFQENDPIGIYRATLIKEKIATEKELDSIDNQVDEQVQAAVQFAESSPEPAMEELFTDIYVD